MELSADSGHMDEEGKMPSLQAGTPLMGHRLPEGNSGGDFFLLNRKRTDLPVLVVNKSASDVSAYDMGGNRGYVSNLRNDPRIPQIFQSIVQLPESLESNLATSTAARAPILPGAYAVNGISPRPVHDILTEFQQPELRRTLAQHPRPTIPGAYAVEGMGTGNDVGGNWGEYGQISEATSVTAEYSESMSASTDHNDGNQQMEILEPVAPPKGRHYWRKKLFLAFSFQANCVLSIVILLLVILFFILKVQGGNLSQSTEEQNGVIQIPNTQAANPTENQVAPTTFLDSLDLPEYTLYAMEQLHCNEKGEIKALEFRITNNLEGTLPPEISFLRNSLKTLAFLRELQVKGTIPTEVGLLTKLTLLDFTAVAISGTVPTQLGLLQSLEELVISTTPISGSLPSELGKLGNLTSFQVVNTDLTGSLPVEFFRMHQLTAIAVMHSPGLISDSLLPEVIGNMPRLQFLALDQRKSGDEMPLPSEIGMLSELDNLHLADWKIDGTLPKELGHLTSLYFLGLEGNSIAETIPPILFQLTNLISLNIESNHLEGSLPPLLFSKLTNLQYLRINNNQFSGSIPTEVGLLSNLKKLQLQNTNLSGPLPMTELLALRNLTSLVVANTSLSGSIPEEMCGRMSQWEKSWFGGEFYEVKSENPVCHGTFLCGCNCTGCV
ncbi:LRR receptor-like serine threonine-protein kinase [Seminavis robusta]|uniref:LRR receptor-like serine threonine-protein kinase n=1 Tax=Seminavis robusta TaxID=568900 RepID=A0A9N8DH60_9STRA|nr:LRR receptor-like serine threonine-protein kinase [Seminavis robusta]|eukprot:Sro118_g057870.1 LRR receptor-like serine threonine-protein kinase (666) ;mRNA; f:93882-96419